MIPCCSLDFIKLLTGNFAARNQLQSDYKFFWSRYIIVKVSLHYFHP